MHERQDLGEARGKSETEKARQNLESEVLVRLNGLSEMSGLRPRSRDGRKSQTVTVHDSLVGQVKGHAQNTSGLPLAFTTQCCLHL